MDSAKIFKSGNSMAVRLPKEYCIAGDEVLIRKVGNVVMLIPKENLWKAFEEGVAMFDPSFKPEREQPEMQERETF